MVDFVIVFVVVGDELYLCYQFCDGDEWVCCWFDEGEDLCVK